MAAAGPVYRQAGCNKKPGQKLKYVLLLKAPNKNGNEKFIAVNIISKIILQCLLLFFLLLP